MFCPGCGRANSASDNFCRYCGKRLKDEPAQDAPTPAQESTPEFPSEFTPDPGPETVPESDLFIPPPDADFSSDEPKSEDWTGPTYTPPAPPVSPVAPAPPAASFDLRGLLNTPLLLVALIALSASVGFNLFSFSNITYVLADESETSLFFSFSTLFSVISAVPDALIVAGSWMTYANVKAGQTKTSGLTMVKVALIIKLVFLCISLGLMELVLIIAAVMFSDLDAFASSFEIDTSEFDAFTASIMQGVFVFLILCIAAAIVLMVIYYVKAGKTTDVFRDTIAGGVPSDRISGFVAVMLCIMGGIVALSALEALADGGLFSVLGSACSATSSLCFGIFLFEYRTKVRRLMAAPGHM